MAVTSLLSPLALGAGTEQVPADGNWNQEMDSGTGFRNIWIRIKGRRMDRALLEHQPWKKRLDLGDLSA